MEIVVILLFLCVPAFCEFHSSHWQNGSTDFLSELENSRVRGVYIPFKDNFPLFNISMLPKIVTHHISEKPTVLPVKTTTTQLPRTYKSPRVIPTPAPANAVPVTTTHKSIQAGGSTRVRIPLPHIQEEDPYTRCEKLLKIYVNDYEALRFEVRTYAIQLANSSLETRSLQTKLRDAEEKNIMCFTDNLTLGNKLKICSKLNRRSSQNN